MSDKTEKPIRVFWSVMGQCFYATQHYSVKADSIRERIVITGKKYDVTEDIARAAVQHDIVFYKAVKL